MNDTYKNDLIKYVDLIFNGYTVTDDLNALREEIGQNLCERFDDMVRDGATPQDAYRKAIQSIGDIEAMIAEMSTEKQASANHTSMGDSGEFTESRKPGEPKEDAQFIQPDADEIKAYKARSAWITTISVVLYILCAAPVVLWGYPVGIAALFAMVGFATFLLIFNSMTKPVAIRVQDDANEIKRHRLFGALRVAGAVMLYIFSPALPALFPPPHGVVWFLVLIGIATGINIFHGVSSKKANFKAVDMDAETIKEKTRKIHNNALRETLVSLLWLCTVGFYLFISFETGRWDVTWLCFLIASAANNLIDSIFSYVGSKRNK